MSNKNNGKNKENIKKKEVGKKLSRKGNNKNNIFNKIKNIFKRKNGNMKKVVYTTRELIIVMLLSLGFGFLMCFVSISIFTSTNYFSVVNDLDKIIDTYYAIVDNYYGNLNKEELIDSAVEGMINSVDDIFTSYTNVENTESFDETINGSYEGIGASVATYSDGSIVVIDVFKGSPSDEAGLKIGDKIVGVDNESLDGKNSNDISSYIKNSGKKNVVLTIVREEEQKNITINLGKVEIPHVSGNVVERAGKKIGYISISLFANNSYKQFKNKLEELEEQGIEGLVIDVRDNSGGYLTSITDICELFLKKGEIIYQLEDQTSIKKEKDNTKENRNYKVAVIINGGSASASEILASVIKENYNGYVVGTTSYGKGTVQQTKKLLDGSMIKYTTQKWLTSLGNCIDGIGVVPTNYVELGEEYYNNPSIDNDNQINEAINLLIK